MVRGRGPEGARLSAIKGFARCALWSASVNDPRCGPCENRAEEGNGGLDWIGLGSDPNETRGEVSSRRVRLGGRGFGDIPKEAGPECRGPCETRPPWRTPRSWKKVLAFHPVVAPASGSFIGIQVDKGLFNSGARRQALKGAKRPRAQEEKNNYQQFFLAPWPLGGSWRCLGTLSESARPLSN